MGNDDAGLFSSSSSQSSRRQKRKLEKREDLVFLHLRTAPPETESGQHAPGDGGRKEVHPLPEFRSNTSVKIVTGAKVAPSSVSVVFPWKTVFSVLSPRFSARGKREEASEKCRYGNMEDQLFSFPFWSRRFPTMLLQGGKVLLRSGGRESFV